MNTSSYAGMPGTLWAPPAPQLIRGARMLIVGYKADPVALQQVLPPGLRPHPNHSVQMNMYEIDAKNTSGFGAFSLTYLTVEIDDHDSHAAEGSMAIPGRYFAYYWNSSQRVINYARENAGIPARLGVRTTTLEDDKLTSVLTVEGQPVITAVATTSDHALGTLGGHLNYYARRQIPAPYGGIPVIDELIELPLPFVADLFEAKVESIQFDFPEGHAAAMLAPTQPQHITSVLYGDVTFTYSMGRRVINYMDQT